MFLFSRKKGKKFEYEIQRVDYSEYNGDLITKFSVYSKEKDGSITNARITVWGSKIECVPKDKKNGIKGDTVSIYGCLKIGLGTEYNGGKRDIEIVCDSAQVEITRKNNIERAKLETEDFEIGLLELPDVDGDLPF